MKMFPGLPTQYSSNSISGGWFLSPSTKETSSKFMYQQTNCEGPPQKQKEVPHSKVVGLFLSNTLGVHPAQDQQ